MPRVKNVTGDTVVTEFTGEVPAGAVVDVPDAQSDGTPLYWHPEIWAPVSQSSVSEDGE